MKKRRRILTLVTVLGLFLAVITGVSLWHLLETDYVSASEIEAAGAEQAADPETEDSEIFEETSRNSEGSRKEAENSEADLEETEENGDFAEEPISIEQETEAEEELPITLTFAGDVLLSDHVLNAYTRGSGIRGVLDGGFQEIIDASDIFMVNEEFPFSDRGEKAPDKQFTFRLPPEKISMFHELGIDIVTLANNHALDFGTDALLDTCKTLDDAGIYRVGAGADLEEAKRPVILERKGKKIGFLGASRVIPVGSWNASAGHPGMLTTYDPALLLQEIENLRPQCDYLVVYVHWGLEKHDRPEEYQRNLAKQYIDAGADVVIGSHPHVLQGLEYYQGKPIVYSLGNFIFGSSIPKTMLLTVQWDGTDTMLRLVPGTSSQGYTKMLTDEGEKQAFFQYMTGLSYGAAVGKDGVVREEP